MTGGDFYNLVQEVLQKQNGSYAHEAVLSAKQLMEISKAFNYFMAEQIQIAPCDHVGEFHYETIAGRFCGVCQRRMEEVNERRQEVSVEQASFDGQSDR